MKKVLAFVLVLAMVLGSVSMAFAATGYKDEAAITNKEAVGVLSMLNVLNGDENGFRPTDTLTRAEAAAIAARLVLGREEADKLAASGAVFSDVPATHWAAGYIAYCVAEGIIAGNGDGTFDPDGLLTVAAFTKMMLCALGYDAEREGLTGANWEANTAALAAKAGISVPATGACTRETAAQLGLNTLEADVVEYDSASTTVQTGSATVVIGGSKAKKVAYTAATPDYNNSGDKTQQLIEKVYGDKVKKNTTTATDDFGNPAKEWTYKNENVTVSKKAFATLTKGYSATSAADKKAVLNSLKNYTIGGTKIDSVDRTSTGNITVPGTPGFTITAGTSIVEAFCARTANGKLVEFFANNNNVITDVIETEYKVSKITGVTTNSKGDISYTGNNGLTGKDFADETTDTIKIFGTIAKDDYVTYVKPAGKDVSYVYPTTKITGTQTAKTDSALTIDGTSYSIGKGVKTATGTVSAADFKNSKKAANYFIDQYGFVVAASDVETDLVYAVVDRIALKTGSGVSSSKTIEAVLIFLDGTKQTVNVSKFDGVKPGDVPATSMDAIWSSPASMGLSGKLYSYEIDSDGKYEIKSQNNTTLSIGPNDTLITKGIAKISDTGIAANADTVYVVKTYKGSSTDEVINVYTGYANVPTIKSGAAATAGAIANYVRDANNLAKMVAVFVDATKAEMGGSDKNIFYATQNASDMATVGTGTDVYNTINGYLNGESTTLKFKSGVTSTSGISKGNFYKLTIADDGYTTDFNSANGLKPAALGTIADETTVKEVALGTIDGYTINADTKVFVIDTDYVMSESTATVITSGSNYWFDVVNSTGTTVEKNTVKTLYIKINE